MTLLFCHLCVRSYQSKSKQNWNSQLSLIFFLLLSSHAAVLPAFKNTKPVLVPLRWNLHPRLRHFKNATMTIFRASLFWYLCYGMGIAGVKFSRHKLLLCSTVCATLLCLALVSIVDRWTPQKIPQLAPMRVNDPPVLSSTEVSSLTSVFTRLFIVFLRLNGIRYE